MASVITSSQYQYVTEPDEKFKCRVCHEVAEEPRREKKCKGLLCKNCSDGKPENCPILTCKAKHPHFDKDTKIKDDIELLPVKCDYPGCIEPIQRGKFQNHIDNKCKYTVICCKYKWCDIKLPREAMEKHEKEACMRHLYLADRLLNPESTTFDVKRYKELKKKGEMSTSPSHDCCNGYSIKVNVYSNGKIEENEDSGDEENDTHSSSTHSSSTHSLSSSPESEHEDNDTHSSSTHSSSSSSSSKDEGEECISLCICFYSDEKRIGPFSGKVNITLLNQLEERNHHEYTKNVKVGQKIQPGNHLDIKSFILHSELCDEEENTDYQKDNTLRFKVSIS